MRSDPHAPAASPQQPKFFESWPDNENYWLKPDGTACKPPGETIKLPAY